MVRDPSIVSPTLTGVFMGGGHKRFLHTYIPTKVMGGPGVVLSCNHSPSYDMAGHSHKPYKHQITHLGRVDIVISAEKFLFLL